MDEEAGLDEDRAESEWGLRLGPKREVKGGMTGELRYRRM